MTEVSDERAEAETVVSVMQQLHAQGRHKWKDMAILYRTNAQSRLFEEQLVSCTDWGPTHLPVGGVGRSVHALTANSA